LVLEHSECFAELTENTALQRFIYNATELRDLKALLNWFEEFIY